MIRIRQWRLQWIIFSFTCGVLLLFLLVAGLLSNWHARRVITETVSENSLEVLGQINKLIDEQLTGIETMAVSIIMNQALDHLISKESFTSAYDQVVTLQSVEQILTEYETMRTDISRIVIYTDILPLYKYKLAWGCDSVLGMGTQSYAALDALISDMDAGFTGVRAEPPSGENGWRVYAPEITYYRRYRQFPSDAALGLLSIGVKASSITAKFGSAQDDDQYLLMDKSGSMLAKGGLFSSDALSPALDSLTGDLPGAHGYRMVRLDGESYIMLYAAPTQHGMRVVQFKPYGEITDGLHALALQIVLTIVALCALAVPLLWILSGFLTRSLKALMRNMNLVSEGNFQVTLDGGFSYEIREMNRNFMSMAYRIERLLKRVEDEAARNREAMLEALQYQVNPHFLCNSLDAINWLAIKQGAPEISDMLSRVGQFYRMALRGTQDTVPVRDELELLRNYIELQKVCFSGQLHYIEEVDADVMDLSILRVLLQPIVENSFKHAFIDHGRDAEILVSAWRDEGMLILKVADNGVGADAEALNHALTAEPQGGKRYGLHNVHLRIVLYYGADYGLKYLPVARGTVALIRIPAMEGRAG